MSDYQTRMAPPIDSAMPPPPSGPTTWPMVIGIIAIVLGSLGLLSSCAGIAGPLFVKFAAAMAEEGGAKESEMVALRGIEQYMGLLILDSILGLVAAALLLVAGIGLLKRTAWSPRAMVIWAIGKIPLVVFATVVGYLVNQAQFEAMANDPQQKTPVPAGLMEAIAAGSAVFTFIFGIALPIFVLVWFTRAKVRAETAGWRAPA
ncbi:MAG: hypothetical protein WD749_09290 [Phycisphaerales bacterium]